MLFIPIVAKNSFQALGSKGERVHCQKFLSACATLLQL